MTLTLADLRASVKALQAPPQPGPAIIEPTRNPKFPQVPAPAHSPVPPVVPPAHQQVSLSETLPDPAGVREVERMAVPRPVRPAGSRWVPEPGERVWLVQGCSSGVGTSVVALALADGFGQGVRLLETCPVGVSACAAAPSAGLGADSGWVRGQRGPLLVEHQERHLAAVGELPVPLPNRMAVSVVDSSWDFETLLAADCWLGEIARLSGCVVLVARASVPGLRRLEACLSLAGVNRCVVALVGVNAKRWPRPVEQALGYTTRQARDMGRIVTFPVDATLAVAGITQDLLPGPVCGAAGQLINLLKGGI